MVLARPFQSCTVWWYIQAAFIGNPGGATVITLPSLPLILTDPIGFSLKKNACKLSLYDANSLYDARKGACSVPAERSAN